MKMVRTAFALVALLQLAACGGGDVNSMPPPEPNPTPKPTPTSNPPISSLTPSQLQSIAISQLQITVTTSSSTGPVGVFPSDRNSSRQISVQYLGNNRYSVSAQYPLFAETIYYSDRSSYSESDMDVFEKAGTQRVDQNSSYDNSLKIYRAGDSVLKLNYVTYGMWEEHQNRGDPRRAERLWFVIGQSTPYSGRPTSGSATYHGIIDGEFVGGSSQFRLGGEGNLTYDFSRDHVAGTFNIDQDDGSGGRKHFDTIKFNKPATSANIKSENGFDGILATYLMGPHAEEAAALFTLETQFGGVAAGVFVGKR